MKPRKPIPKKRVKPRVKKGLFDDLKKEKKNLFKHLEKPSKTNEWATIRAELKIKFAAAGVLCCELQLKGCTGACNFGYTWSFAHSLKRTRITKEPEERYRLMREVAYACGNCHEIIEKRGNEKILNKTPTMEEIVKDRISKRTVTI